MPSGASRPTSSPKPTPRSTTPDGPDRHCTAGAGPASSRRADARVMAPELQPTIRDLIAELAETEDVLRGCRDTAGARERSTRRRQGQIVTELRRRHPRFVTG